MKILYLEDDANDAELARRALQKTAPHVALTIATTLRAARLRLKPMKAWMQEIERGGPPVLSAPPFDLVLTDMSLPDGNGLDLLAHIRSESLPLAVVVMTGAGDEETVVTALRAGADDYVVKRGDYLERLAITLRSALENFRAGVARQSHPLRVLYADPDSAATDRVRRHLARYAPQLRLDLVHDATQTLNRLPALGPRCYYDVLLLDHRLPGMNGLEALKELRQARALDVPIVIVAAQGDEEIAAQALKLGAADYLVKGPDYLYRLPAALENAYFRAELLHEQTALRESEIRYRTIVESEPECVKLLDRQGHLIEMNPAGLAMLEADELAQVLDAKVDQIVVPEYRAAFQGLLNQVFEGGSGRLEFEIVGLKGTRRWLDTHAVPLRNAEGQVTALLGITRDVTERKRIETQLRQSQKMEAIGQLTGGLAHDFNNALGVIIGNLDLVERDLQKRGGQEASLKRVQTALKSALREAELTKRLLAFSRSQVPQSHTAVDVNSAIKDMLDLMQRSLGPSIPMEMYLQDDLGLAQMEPNEFSNVLLNLAINARDAMVQGGRLIIHTSSYIVDAENVTAYGNHVEPGDYVTVSITDTGSGMSPQVQARLFEPFFTTKPHGKGTGLGLAMVYAFVTQSKGWVKVYSEVDRGTTVILGFPYAQGDVDTVVKPVNDLMPRGHETILAVDDEAALLEIATLYLEELGYRVMQASDAPAALTIIEEHPGIDLLFTDLIMPGGMDGLDLARAARKRRPKLKLLLTSAFPKPLLENKEQHKFPMEILSKPYRRVELAQHVRQALDG